MCRLQMGTHTALGADVRQIARQPIADIDEAMERAVLAEILRLP
jgi:hypothetical protein